jgi:Flp pilus assembly protein TadG
VGNNKRERGASLVEFAFVLPFLLILALGIVEFGFVLGQMNDVRYGAREGARLAASNAASASTMRGLVCSAMDQSSGQTVTFTDSAGGAVGEEAVITVSTPVQSVTGAALISSLLPSSLSSTARARLEKPSTNWSTETGACP